MSMYCITIGTRAHALVRLLENKTLATLGNFSFEEWRDFRKDNSDLYEVIAVDIFFDEVQITLVHKEV